MPVLKERRVAMIFRISPRLRNAFKALCARKGETMIETITDFMRGEIESGGSACDPPTISDKSIVVILRPVPMDVRDLFKSVCATKGISMQDHIIAFIQKTVRKG